MTSMTSHMIARANEAIDANPSSAYIALTRNGSSWLFAVCAIMIVSALVMMFLAKRRPLGMRAFHHVSTFTLITAAISYFAMASNLGNTPVLTNKHLIATRAISYVRYIDWFITTPLLLLLVLLGTGLPMSDILAVLFFDEVMIICGLSGALVVSNYKWGFFTFGLASLIYIWVHLLGPGRHSSHSIGADWGVAYSRGTFMLAFIWMLYPIAWGLSEGSNTIGLTGEMIFYGILDILAKPVFIFFHINAISRLDYAALHLASGKFVNTSYTHTTGTTTTTHGPRRNWFGRGEKTVTTTA